MFTILDYSSALEYSIIRRYTNIVYYYNHLISFIDKETILYKSQFGFRKSHSTNHAIISLVENVNQALDSGNVLVGVFLDLKKAFDTVDHKILIDKLQIWH